MKNVQGEFKDCEKIYNSLTQEEKVWFGNRFINSPNLVYRRVIKENNEAIAFCELVDAGKLPGGIDGDVVFSVAVKNGHRQKKLGKKLLMDAIEWFNKSKFESMTYRVWKQNIPSIKLAESLGLRRIPQKILFKEIQDKEYVYALFKNPPDYMVTDATHFVTNFDKLEGVAEMNNRYTVATNVLFSENDIYVNMDKLKDVNICFVTGFSGSGKSTLARKFALKQGAIYVELDLLIYYGRRNVFTKEELYNRRGEILWMYIEDTKKDPAFMKGTTWRDRKKIRQESIEYIKWLETKPTSPSIYVIEGVDLVDIIPANPDWYEYPIIFKGTSVIKSMIRKTLRDGVGVHNLDTGLEFCKEMIAWYNSMKSGQDFLRDKMITAKNHFEIGEDITDKHFVTKFKEWNRNA